MSGGALDYAYSKINCIREDIGGLFDNDFKSENPQTAIYENVDDYLQECKTDDVRNLIKSQTKELYDKLNECSGHLYVLEMFLSGDYGVNSYLNEMKKLKEIENGELNVK